ncbi:TetR/AcrR family transcriptional regulator [Thalassovita mediterranea]|jgi:AcrR family transcriptional regulator|uniref:Bacterial regulatory proteins, tetR family n=1 Tax=Thalassovita mediterranea TaxID=340021 RepID=A0A0P1GLB3_9RHOB|nr:TetR/AcrR family transcriptional regulator [Thalassovita mediterranea]CUH82893.1 Bacterial regulatory proteins, tetR family [Thalassovita mediterranea]SIS31451.1 transcriptional regulator, TetR family [Thalassovita mediterranea]
MTSKTRLSKADWLKAGFTALTEGGPSALKAEPLARRLGTSKGSFYWHFADVAAFQSAMLDVWEAEALTALTTVIEEEPNAGARLRRLAAGITDYSSTVTADTNPERLIRAWAKDAPTVAERLTKVDGLRLDLLNGLLQESGISNPDWAQLILAASVGLKELPQTDNAPMGSLIDLVMSLR